MQKQIFKILINNDTLCNTTVDKFEIDHDIESNVVREDRDEKSIEFEETLSQIQSDDHEGENIEVSIVDETKSNHENNFFCNTEDDQTITKNSKGSNDIEFSEKQEDNSATKHTEDKLVDPVIKRMSKRGTMKYKWIVECHLDSRDIVCVLY